MTILLIVKETTSIVLILDFDTPSFFELAEWVDFYYFKKQSL
jgi:hypothetical protein